MTNIIVGNIVVGFISVILGNAGHALIHNKLAYSIVDVLVAITLITIYYFLGKYNYKVKVWQVIIIGVVNATIWWATNSKLLIMLTMGPMGVVGVVIEEIFGQGEFLYLLCELTRIVTYALICLGIMVGRRKNHEQYEAFVAIEKERKEQRKAYRDEQRKRDNGEL